MFTDSILDELFEERMITALEQRLAETEDFRKASKQVRQKHLGLIKMGLTDEQKQALDETMSAMNFCSSEYGRAAYRQGFTDAVQLIVQMVKLPFAESKEK